MMLMMTMLMEMIVPRGGCSSLPVGFHWLAGSEPDNSDSDRVSIPLLRSHCAFLYLGL
jgi:hypothetical protein